MLTAIYMALPRLRILVPRPTAALAARLEVLTGTDGACCALDLHALAGEARAAPAFRAALSRYEALGDERRLLAATLLKQQGEMCACEMQAALGLTHATVSHHMGALVDAGLVTSEKRGKWVHYRLAAGAAELLP
jgi:ArsR family transcriptional regulator